MLDVGAKLPDLTVNDETGTPVRLHDLVGKPLVFWFYPKADTPG